MFKNVKYLILLIILTLFIISPAYSKPKADWTTLADNTKVYGYWLEFNDKSVLVECNPNTNEETGYAFINSGKWEEKEKEVVDTYEYVKKEDFSRVTGLHPVTVDDVFAPNIPIGIGWDREHYLATGESRNTTKSHVSWPGSRTPRIVPGTHPDYWLIVAMVTNPNPFPVKANVEIDLWGSSPRAEFNGELTFEANETKYIKLNDGPLTEIKDEEGEWDDDDWDVGWSSVWINTDIEENLDPELPDNLKPNSGWADSFWGFDLDLSDPEVLNQSMVYRFKMREHSRRMGYWGYSAEGYARYTEDGWKISFREISKPEKEEEAKELMKNWIESKMPNLPIIEDDDPSVVIKGTAGWTNDYTYIYEFESYDALLVDGAAIWKWDQLGPIIVGYTGGDLDEYEEDWDGRPLPRLEDPSIVGWHEDKMPVLEKEYIFIPWYEFKPVDGKNIGYLKKTVKPGYYIDDDHISVPKFEITTKYIDWNKQELSDGKTRFTFTFDVNIDAVNESPYDCKFTANSGNMRFYMPKVRFLKNFLQYHNSVTIDKHIRRGRYRDKITTYTYYNEPNIVTPEFDIADLGIKSVTIPKNSRKTVCSQRRTIAFDITQRKDYDLNTETFQKFLNDSREAIFSNNGGGYVFEIIPNDKLMGLTRSEFTYKYYDWGDDDFEHYRESEYGCPRSVPIVSYLHDGISVLTDSELYAYLNRSRKLKISVPGRYSLHSDFWPVAEGYSSSESPDVYPKDINLYNRDEFFSRYLSVEREKDVDYR